VTLPPDSTATGGWSYTARDGAAAAVYPRATPPEQTALTRQVAATDTQIDRLVYDLYGLTEDEIQIVEGAAGLRAAHQGKE
jgi:hypothetical protein